MVKASCYQCYHDSWMNVIHSASYYAPCYAAMEFPPPQQDLHSRYSGSDCLAMQKKRKISGRFACILLKHNLVWSSISPWLGLGLTKGADWLQFPVNLPRFWAQLLEMVNLLTLCFMLLNFKQCRGISGVHERCQEYLTVKCYAKLKKGIRPLRSGRGGLLRQIKCGFRASADGTEAQIDVIR